MIGTHQSREGILRRFGAPLLLLLVLAPGLAAQRPAEQGGFVVLRGADTLAVERFSRGVDRLEGELLDRTIGQRWSYAAQLGPGGLVPTIETAIRTATAAEDAPPWQRATLTFRGDSVIAEIRSGESTQTQRLGSREGALPYLNLSLAIVEQILHRARALGGERVEVPLFAVSGGQTFAAAVERRGRDSAVVSLGGVEMRLATDSEGRVLGGGVPAQGISLRRVERPGALRATPPDYSAPGDAPYTAEEVRVRTPAGHTLAGTLTLPRQRRGRIPAAVLITGSGQQDRDESLLAVPGYRPFRQIADTLSRRGIAVLRLDDRGFGESGGDATTATSADLAEDVRAALDFLRARPEIDPQRLGLIGHSEGAMIAPMLAARDREIRALVLMAGPSWSGRRIITYQSRFLVENNPALPAAARDSLLLAAEARVDSMAANLPWMRYFLAYDPLPAARQVQAPVLILQGATDRQITAEQAEELGAAIREGGNRDVTVRVFPDLNHLFLPDPDGSPLRYAELQTREVPAEVLGVLADWVVRQLAATGR